MKMRTASLLLGLLLLGAAAPAALAQQQPLLSVNMTDVQDLTNGNLWGATSPYISGSPSSSGAVNGGFGAYTDTVEIWALATGTFPTGGFTYTFFVNGQTIGSAVNVPTTNNDDIPQSVGWTPPEPGTYYFSVMATDSSGHSATSLPVQYFATGVSIVSPVNNTFSPLGSSVVIQAAAAIYAGAVARVEFFSDGASIGSSVNYPYSIIYTPPGPIGTVHFIRAQSYLADNVTVAATTPLQSIIVVAPVLPLPLCSIGSPTQTSPPTTIPIPDYNADAAAYIPVIVNAGGANNITEVQLYINGVLFQTLDALPYNFQWQPTVAGTYNLTALAYDGKNNVIASTTSTTASITPAPTTVIVGSLPSVAITTPTNDATISGVTTLIASATDTNVDSSGNLVAVTSVQFFQDGQNVGTAKGPTANGIYTISFTPTQKVDPTTGAPEVSVLTAIATDALNFQGVSSGVDVQVLLGGSSGGVVVGTPPTISITAPSASATVVVNTPVTLSASASAANGNVAEVDFSVDGVVLQKVTKYPYSATWTPANLGFYSISAEVIDNVGDKSNSAPITVTVTSEPPPTVSVASPASGQIVTVGTAVTISANAASSAASTIAMVQFYANGILIGSSTTQPYSVTFTPPSTGIYTLTAVATDSSGEVTTSSTTEIEAAPVTGGVGTVVYFGNYQGIVDTGVFALVVNDGVSATYIGIPLGTSQNSVNFITDLPVGSNGSFASTAPSGAISGNASSTGTTGTLLGNDVFIGGILPAASYSVASGFYTGNLGGVPGSNVAAIVGADGSIFLYLSNGSFTDAGYAQGAIDATGAFSIPTYQGNTITGTVNPTTSLLTAAFSGPSGGTVIAGKVSGGTFSDGVLKNISTRGSVGSGANAMIAGFVVGGTANKQLLVRAAGPSLSNFGITGAVAATQLTVMNSSQAVVAANTGWSSTTVNAAAVSAADTTAGAFPFAAGSADSAIVGSFPPGSYTATVTGAGGDTGIGLVEVYDLDAFSPFTANKLVDVATRGDVGSGNAALIAGFVINGTAPKRLLIRGDGPALAMFNVSGPLATPHLQLYSGSTVIRENYSWGVGNDPGLISAAEKASGAFAFANGSADSAILITLNPGSYTVEVSGANSATGNSIVEVYEVP